MPGHGPTAHSSRPARSSTHARPWPHGTLKPPGPKPPPMPGHGPTAHSSRPARSSTHARSWPPRHTLKLPGPSSTLARSWPPRHTLKLPGPSLTHARPRPHSTPSSRPNQARTLAKPWPLPTPGPPPPRPGKTQEQTRSATRLMRQQQPHSQLKPLSHIRSRRPTSHPSHQVRQPHIPDNPSQRPILLRRLPLVQRPGEHPLDQLANRIHLSSSRRISEHERPGHSLGKVRVTLHRPSNPPQDVQQRS